MRTQKLRRRLDESSPDVLTRRPDLYALALLKQEKAELLASSYMAGFFRDGQAERYLDEADGILTALIAGRNPVLETRGRLERAYLCESDMSAQPYMLYVPKSYDGSKPSGLLVYLHGYSPDLNKENWVRYMYADVLDEYAEECGFIMLMPFARGNTDFQGAGEDDVMRVIEEVTRHYRIAPDRIVLSGYSMGGMGVWTIGAHYVHRFAGLLAISSRADFYLWKGIRPEDLPGFKRKLIEQEFGASLLPNYAHLPVYMMHGGADFGISVTQSRRMHTRLQEGGVDVRYVELPQKGHLFLYYETGCRADLVEWLRSRLRPAPPRKITYRTHTLKYNTAYWLEILAIADWGRAADVRCELSDDGKSLKVETENVTVLRLQPPRELVGDPAALKVTWNGKVVAPVADKSGHLVLDRLGTRDAPEFKSRRLCGPVREAFAGPFVMVYGGQDGGETHDRALSAATDWTRFAQGMPRLLPASALTEEIVAAHNLILFGTPEDNPVMAKVMPHLPIRIEDGSFYVGDRQYKGDSFGLWMIYPSPLAADRYVVINSGPPWGRGLPVNHKYDFIPDFIIYTDEKSQDGTECNKFACAGFFDQFWRLSDQSTWYSDPPR